MPSVHLAQLIRNASDRHLFDSYSDLDSSDLSLKEIKQLRKKVFEAYSDASKNLVFLKTHDSFKNSTFSDYFISAQSTKAVIYIIRNPLDIVISYAAFKNRTIDKTIEVMLDQNARLSSYKKTKLLNSLPQEVSSWSNHVTSWIEQKEIPLIVIRYEDLLFNTTTELLRIVDFLKLNSTEEEIKIAVNKCNFNQLQIEEKEYGFAEKDSSTISFFRKGVAGEGLTVLTKKQIATIKNNFEEQMKLFGYI